MSELYTDELVTLHLGSHQDLTLDRPADVAIVDPPYGDTALVWDRLATDWLATADRLLAPTSSLWLWGSLRSLSVMLPASIEAGWTLSQDLVWEKHNGSGSAADRFRRVHEHVVLLYRGAWSEVHHETQFSLDATPRQVRRKQRPVHWGAIGESAYETEDGGPRLMRSVQFERSSHGSAIHPTQKPLGLTRTLIEYSCPVDGTVLVPYSGSGTELIAARQAGRRAVGAEIHPDYVAASIERLMQPDQSRLDLTGAVS